jgi:hypothetical protein
MDRTLQDLEGNDWGEPTFPSRLVQRCHELRKKRLRDFTVEDLRLMIGQGIGLDYLIPLAIEHLQDDPLAAGDFYAGDLLVNVLKVERKFWQVRPALRQMVQRIVDSTDGWPEEVQGAVVNFRDERRFVVSKRVNRR